MVKAASVTPRTSVHEIHREIVDGEADAVRKCFAIATNNHTLIKVSISI